MWKLRTDKEGRWALFRPYEWYLFNYMIDMKDEVVSTVQAWEYLVKVKSLQISRASVIHKMKDWAKDGLLTTTDASGRGGLRKDYTMIMTREEADRHVVNKLLKSINGVFPKLIVAQLHESK